MLSGAPGSANVVLDRHFAVVDVERTRPFAVVTDDYELITNEQAFEQAEAVMRRVFNTTSIRDFECLNVTMPKTRSFCPIDLIHRSADFNPWEEDSWTAFLRISNSYNRTRLLRFELVSGCANPLKNGCQKPPRNHAQHTGYPPRRPTLPVWGIGRRRG